MTHDEVRRLLPGYAAGALDDAEVEVVHAHLAGGCQDCLHEVYRRPVGLPRPDSRPARASPLAPRADASHIDASRTDERREGRGAFFAAALAALLGVASLAVALRVRSGRVDSAPTLHVEAPPPASIPEGRRDLAGAVAGETPPAPPVDESGAPADPDVPSGTGVGERPHALETADDHPERPPERSVDQQTTRLLQATEPGRTLQELAVLPGVSVLRLAGRDPVAGHVVWHPDRAEMVLSASGLAPLPSGAFYRVRIVLGNGEVDEGVAFRPRPGGAVAIALRPRAAAGGVQGVDVLRESDETPVLTGRADPTG